MPSQPGPPADRVPYSERKPYVVADNLDDLTGPTSGTITIPRGIDWSGRPQRNLDQPNAFLALYPTVPAEAATVADLNRILNRDTLIAVWPDLFLPAKIRRLWQQRFPELCNPNPNPNRLA